MRSFEFGHSVIESLTQTRVVMLLNVISFEQRLNFIGQRLYQLALLQVDNRTLVKFVVQLFQLRAQFFVIHCYLPCLLTRRAIVNL